MTRIFLCSVGVIFFRFGGGGAGGLGGYFSFLDQVEITVRCQPRSAALPAAHTCFFQLDVPDYDKESVLRHKLLQAVNNTASFDVV